MNGLQQVFAERVCGGGGAIMGGAGISRFRRTESGGYVDKYI